MGRYANKQYAKKMAELYNLRLERSHKEQSLVIFKKDNQMIFQLKLTGPPEVAWEYIWRYAREAVEEYTGIQYYDDWEDL